MLLNLRRSFVFAIVAMVITFIYMLAGTGLSQLVFSKTANGSITANGSTLIGQNWYNSKTFHGQWFLGRPDDMGPYAANPKENEPGGDNPLVANVPGSSALVDGESAATNLGPRSEILLQNTEALIALWHKLGVPHPTPDLVTTSGSGLDPDIAPEDARAQIPMVSKATGIAPSALEKLISRETHSAEWGFLGSSYIDVLQLNEGLAKLRGTSATP
ncbi:MAG TPA: potassium-transporting ATPase subunit C [Acidimicrobiales bacterium]|nr:potassium-transporting ATPase subunit C [Acidimicrobiales bacterium]